MNEPPESEAARETRIRMEIARREMELRARRPVSPNEDRGGGGHAAKAGFRGVTLLLVLIAVLGALWLLKRASTQLELPERPGAGRSW